MLSNEEKKAIEYLKIEYEKLMKGDNILFPLYKSDAKRLINLIEKQSKEIEELTLDLEEMTKSNNHKKENWVHKNILNSYVSKDKIKAKIEECEKEKNIPQEMDFIAFYRIEDLKNIEIAVLQSLLEKVGENNGTTEQMH